MAVVRQLVTKLSFDVDRRGVENFNRTIKSFKTQFLIATSAATAFVAGFIKSMNVVAENIIDTDRLARSLGVTTKQFVAFQKTAQNFQVKPEEFIKGMESVNNLIQQAKLGFGDLERIAREGGIEIRDDQGKLKPTLELVREILDSLSKVENEQNRLLLSQQVFGTTAFADLSKNLELVDELLSKYEEAGEDFDKAIDSAKRYDSALQKLSTTVTNLSLKILPPLFELTGKILENFDKAIDEVKQEGFLEFISNDIKRSGQAFTDFINSSLDRFGLPALQPPTFPSKEVVVNNDINITVPPGTEESQRQFIEQAAQESYDVHFRNTMEVIGNDFPISEQ